MSDIDIRLILEKIKKIDSRTERIEKFIIGTGEGEPGAMVRIDRLEQGAKQLSRFVWLFVTTTVVGSIAYVLKGFK